MPSRLHRAIFHSPERGQRGSARGRFAQTFVHDDEQMRHVSIRRKQTNAAFCPRASEALSIQ